MSWECPINDAVESIHDIILGRDPLTTLGLD